MKHSLTAIVISVIAAPVFLLSSCQKLYDYVGSHPDADIKICAIVRFSFSNQYSFDTDTLNFTYNAAGNPVKAIRKYVGTGAPNLLFRYKNGRLSDFIGVYGDGSSTEYWHKYLYESSGRVSIDSVYLSAEIVNGEMTNPFDSYAIHYTYDNKDRIIESKYIFSDNSFYQENYTYDANGNKTGYQYDQKVAFRRANKIWMFLDRDYSMNNTVGASHYNSFGMPTQIDLGDEILIPNFLSCYYNKARIDYLCR